MRSRTSSECRCQPAPFDCNKKDDKGNQQFIGEDKIDHSPKDEDVRVKVGDAFDIVAERKQTDYKVIVSGHLYEYAYEIKNPQSQRRSRNHCCK